MVSAWSALVPAIGWALLHFIWQGLLIGWGVSLALLLLRKARPQTRYAVACAGLLLCAALPLAGVIAQVNAAETSSFSGAGLGAALLIPVLSAGAGAAPAANLVGDGTMAALEAALRGQLPWIVGLWLGGAALMALRLAVGLQWVAERTRGDHYTVNHYWQRRLSEMARRFGIPQHVRLGVADLLDSPITAGCWRPIVLVPAALVTGMAPNLLEALLAHELAHIKRRDYLINLIQSAVEIVLFYHPSVWALSRRIRVEREQIADDLAVSMLGQPQVLAKALSELDQFQFDTTQLAHAAHGGNLMSRIKRLLRPDVEPVSWKMAVPLIGLCAASAVFYVQAATQPPAPPAPVAAAAPPALPALPAASAPPAPPAAAAPVAAVAPVAPAAAVAAAAPAPAVPAIPATPAMPPAPVSAASTWERDGSAYAIVRGGDERMTVSANRKDLARVEALRRSVRGDFVWFRDGDKAYLIQDPAFIAKVQQVWEPANRIGAQMDEQGQKMDQHSKVMDGISAKLEAEARETARGTERDMELHHRAMEQVARQQESIGRRMEQLAREVERDPDQAKIRSFHEQQEKLRAEMVPLSKQMAQFQRDIAAQTAKLQAARAPMRELERKMAEASRPMAELGARMGELGRQQAQASREAERAMKALVRDAVRSGAATPAPSA
ncbi:beta-lactamase regulating signal transducer with metallopeptidase domain [Duganella sp. 1411]|uniref:M56 family metallopeptidase n=1 Tax=Duganella sp. 1411 TaxID=2806572 RepID=UPI001AE52D2F|nr:M56 family metallopeptidase [Duganella sp. 1411]MBP1207151.1 beta-lactamase regulating signal transducer with metallopeptidase domain [Duganella sp. 1411]